MRSPAEPRNGQATSEWLVIVVLVAALALAGIATLRQSTSAQAIAARLTGTPTPPAASMHALQEAVTGRADALSISGARAWLAESLGTTAADQQLEVLIGARLATHHAAWLASLTLPPLPGRAPSRRVIALGDGPVAVRLVDPDDERLYAAGVTTMATRTLSAAESLAWDGAGVIAGRIGRPVAFALSAVQLLIRIAKTPATQAPGTRADDIVLCRRVRLVTTSHTGLPLVPLGQAWRVGVLRQNRLILDAIRPDDAACSGPAGS